MGLPVSQLSAIRECEDRARISVGETVSEHRSTTLGFRLRRLVLKHIPVFDEHSIHDAEDVRRDPLFGRPCPEKRPWTITKSPSATMTPGSYVSVDGTFLIRLERPSRPGLDMSAVLDVVRRPVALSRHIVSLVEEGIEGLEDKCFVLRLLVPTHILLRVPSRGSCGLKVPRLCVVPFRSITVWRLVEIFEEVQQSSAFHHVRTDASFLRSVD